MKMLMDEVHPQQEIERLCNMIDMTCSIQHEPIRWQPHLEIALNSLKSC
jgi:hypothetical protein